MSFTAILGCCSRVLQTAAILEMFTDTFCKRVRATQALLGVDLQAVQGPQTYTLAAPLCIAGLFFGNWGLYLQSSVLLPLSVLCVPGAGCLFGHR